MKKWMAILLAVLVLALCGCGSSVDLHEDREEVKATEETTAEPTNEELTEEISTQPTDEDLTEETNTQSRNEELTELELEYFSQMFSLEQNYGGEYWWYNMAMTSEYACPEDLDLYNFFYNGFKDEIAGAEEREKLEKAGLWMELDIQKNPREKMDTLLKTYFGLSLEQMSGVGLEYMIYLEETDSYYKCAGDFCCGESAQFHRGYWTEDGRIVLHYQNFLDDEWVITLVETPEGAQMPYYVFSHMPKS